MPRRSSGGFGRGRSSSPPPRRAATMQAPPRPAQHAPSAQSGGMGSGFMGMMAQGMAFGAGSAVAHEAVSRRYGRPQ